MYKITWLIKTFIPLIISMNMLSADPGDYIQPWRENPRYWQYEGKPVLLLGGSATDTLFLYEPLLPHLDEIAAAGGNYVRNTIFITKGLSPYAQGDDELFDLNDWNPAFWERFETFLKETQKRGIIVQIEIWDRFGYSRDHWERNPFNPACNSNYSSDQSGLDDSYEQHPSKDENPFFHSIPGMPKYDPRLDLVRGYQERFVDRLLSISLRYPHVLYCMDNETSTPPEWGQYWIRFVRSRASEAGIPVQTTDMFDDMFLTRNASLAPVVFKHPDLYSFVDCSQINSRLFSDMHWIAGSWVMSESESPLRPVNCTKIYGGGNSSWGSGSNRDGVERFLRNLWHGMAAVRFHRPKSGNGLNERAKNTIASVRMLEAEKPWWESIPLHRSLVNREHEVYVRGLENERYELLFTFGGDANLKVGESTSAWQLRWLEVETAEWVGGAREIVPVEGVLRIECPKETVMIAVLTRG